MTRAGCWLRQNAHDRALETRGVEAGHLQTVLACPVLDEAVGQPDVARGEHQTRCRQGLVYRAARAARDDVLLDGHDCQVRGSQPPEKLDVERLYEPHVDQRRVQPVGDRHARRHHGAEGEQQQTAATFAAQFATPDRERAQLLFDTHPGALAARIAHRCRTVVRRRGVEHLPALVLVRGRHDHHVRYAAQEGEIEGTLVRRTVAADEPAAVDRERNRQVLQRHVVDQLVVRALQEGRVDGDDRSQPLAGESGGEGDRVLLGDRDIEIALGEAPRILDQARAFAHRGRDADDARIALRHVAQPLAEDLRIGGAARLVLEDRAAAGIERTRAMPLDRIRLRRRVALALARDDVQELRSVAGRAGCCSVFTSAPRS